jgi:hypothetical protein
MEGEGKGEEDLLRLGMVQGEEGGDTDGPGGKLLVLDQLLQGGDRFGREQGHVCGRTRSL